MNPNYFSFLFSCLLLANGLAGWEAVPQITAESRNAGVIGGEGCQWPQTIAAEPQAGKRLLFGTDVGGIYRSEDSGATWQPSNTGFNARGTAGFAFDPGNPDRVLVVAANSLERPFHGISLYRWGRFLDRYAYTASNCFGLWRYPPPK